MEKSSGAPMVLIADDNIDDCVIASRAWDESRLGFDVMFVHNGREVMDFLHRRGRFYNMTSRPDPRLIVLDLNMPRMDGRQVLVELRLVPQFSHIPVVVFSDSKMPKDMAESETMGAFEYISKPESFYEYVEIIKDLVQRIMNKPKRYAYANR